MRRTDPWGRPTRLGAVLAWAGRVVEDYRRCEVRRLARHDLSGWETRQLLEVVSTRPDRP